MTPFWLLLWTAPIASGGLSGFNATAAGAAAASEGERSQGAIYRRQRLLRTEVIFPSSEN